METIGGYRIIRRLGSGSRSDVYLGHTAPVGGESKLAAIKLFKPQVSAASTDAEINALSRLSHAHIVRLIDLATGPRDAPCLILQRLMPGGLPGLLADRRELEPGEAVTILAPLVSAVAAMHRRGVVHGRLSARAVLFDDSGAPVLIGFGGATSMGGPSGDFLTEASLDSDPRVIAERDALVALVGSVVNRLSGAPGHRDGFTQWLGEQRGEATDLATLEHRLFAMAEPIPVQFDGEVQFRTDERSVAVPNRLGTASGDRPAYSGGDAVATVALVESSQPGRLRRLPLPAEIVTWLNGASAQAPDRILARMRRVTAAVHSIRRRVWMVAGIGLLAVMAALMIAGLPASGDGDDGATAPPPTESPRPVTPTAVGGDDPIAAAQALLRLRASCLVERSILCLDAVHAPDSAAWQADAARIQGVQGGAEIASDPFGTGSTITLIDRMGQTALLAFGQADAAPTNATASALIIRTEAGWRFRSLLVGSSQLGG